MKIQITLTLADEEYVDVNDPSGLTEEGYVFIDGALEPYGDVVSVTQVNEPVDLSGRAMGGAGLNLGR